MRECFGDGAVGQVLLGDAMVEVAGAQRFGQAREQRALLVRGRRMHQHAELVGAVVAQDLRRARQASSQRRFAPFATVLHHRLGGAIFGVQPLVRIPVAAQPFERAAHLRGGIAPVDQGESPPAASRW